MKLFVFKQDGKLIPCTSEDKEKVDKLPVGEPFQIKYVEIRNVRFLRKYWALVNIILQNIPETVEENLMKNHQFRIKTKDDVHFYIKIKNGFIEKKYIGKDGNIAWVPKSISFDKMSESDFEEFFSKAIDTACELLTVESDEIMNELMNFI